MIAPAVAVALILWGVFAPESPQEPAGDAEQPVVVSEATSTVEAAPAGILTREDFILVARTAGFERDHVIEEAYRVACGGGSTRWGESACRPSVQNGSHIGLLQLNAQLWGDYCGVDGWELRYPAVNLYCARQIILYSEARGLDRWHFWQVKPQ